jgi:hydrogenase nickel incorporation protein HypA/HybF
MHELTVAKEIIDIVRAEMRRQGLHRIEAVALRIGALTGINADALEFGFDASITDTPLAGARLIIEILPVRAACRSCGRESEIEPYLFKCPHCAGSDLEIVQGEELDIDHLLGE